jgi:hypothetical protein
MSFSHGPIAEAKAAEAARMRLNLCWKQPRGRLPRQPEIGRQRIRDELIEKLKPPSDSTGSDAARRSDRIANRLKRKLGNTDSLRL